MSDTKNFAALPEIEYIERLEAIEGDYARRYGIRPFNISHWDSSTDFDSAILSGLRLPTFRAVTSYRFSYQLSEVTPVIEKLGGAETMHRGLFAPSSTTSIVCLLNWLRNRREKKLLVICPAYFALFHVCPAFGIRPKKAYMRRVDSRFRLPPKSSPIWRNPSVLWITNPVYGAGVYLCEEDVQLLASLLEAGWTVISDECLCYPGRELIRQLGRYEGFVSIYSPHKCVCLNAVKFSIAAFHATHLKLIERWSDIWYGGINLSSSVAIAHFLSPNYPQYVLAFQQAILPPRLLFNSLCSKYGAEIDCDAQGHFVTCYFPDVPSRLGNSIGFLRKLIFGTGGSLISGNRSRFNPKCGFCFRVNLARAGRKFEPTLTRLLKHIVWHLS
jgi:histidinol-phosphate/aromatic aminotransferase/cobyric acid decarboxylase-like protein